MDKETSDGRAGPGGGAASEIDERRGKRGVNAYGELLDGPEHAAALGLVLDGAGGGLEARRVDVGRHWDRDLHERRDRLPLELRLRLPATTSAHHQS